MTMTTIWPQIIVHADMDAFYAAVGEQRRSFAMAARADRSSGCAQRRTATSYEARPFRVGAVCDGRSASALSGSDCCDTSLNDTKKFRVASWRFSARSPTRRRALSLDEAFIV